MASKFERSLDAARSAYERNDPYRALRALDSARRDAVGRNNEEQLRHVLEFAEGVIPRDERTEIERENVLYATKQNLRQVSRRRAYEAQREWVDPYPDLETPRTQTRTFFSRGLKFWIGVGVVIGVLLVAAFVASAIVGAFSSGGDELLLRVRNDTERFVKVKWCTNADCTGEFDPQSTTRLEPGEYKRRDLPADDVVDVFVIEDANGHKLGCLPIRVDKTWKDLPVENVLTVVRVSEATPCPGRIVTPSLAG